MRNYNKRCIEIIYFFLEKKTLVSGKELALNLGVTTRTIRNDIKEINDILEDFGAVITSEIGLGYTLMISDEERFEDFFEEIKATEKFRNLRNIIPSDANERIWYITSQLLLHSLDQTEKLDSYSLEEQLFVSDSTFRKDLRTIEKILKEYDLKISETQKKGLHIVGEEARIRFCISQYVFNNQETKIKDEQFFYEDVFSKKNTEGVKNILTKAIINYDIKLTDIAFNNLVVHTLIMLKRSERKQHVNYSDKDIEMLKNTNEYHCALNIIELIGRETDYSLSDEVLYLTQHLIASQRFLIEDLNDDYAYKEVVIKILAQINESMQIDLSDDLQLVNGLALHLTAALQRLRFEMNIRNEFLDVLKNSYPLAFELAAIAGRIIEEDYALTPGEAEIGFLTMHFGASLERKGLNGEHNLSRNESKKKKKVVLVCIAGVAMALLLKEKLLRKYGDFIDIVQTCPAQQVSEKMLDEVDLILTTVDLPKNKTEKIKKISLFPNDEDFNELTDLIVENNKTGAINYGDIFKRELFFTQQDFKNKDEVLNYMTDSMIKREYMDASVKESVFRREEISTTEMGGLLAIPHAMLDDIENFAVSIMILKKPIIWDKQKVQVIFLLNIPKKKYEVWERIIKNLYTSLITNAGVKRLIKHQNYDQFIFDIQNGISHRNQKR